MIFPRETTTHILSLLLYTHVKKNEVITFLHLNKCILIIPMGCSPIRLIPTYILPAIETILLERFRRKKWFLKMDNIVTMCQHLLKHLLTHDLNGVLVLRIALLYICCSVELGFEILSQFYLQLT